MQRPHTAYSDPGPPSSHSLSELYKQVSSQSVAAHGKGDGGGGGEMLTLHPARGPQSEQSVQRGHNMIPDPGFTSAPAPPSSQSPSPLQVQVFVHVRGADGGADGDGGEHCPMTTSAAKMTRTIASRSIRVRAKSAGGAKSRGVNGTAPSWLLAPSWLDSSATVVSPFLDVLQVRQ